MESAISIFVICRFLKGVNVGSVLELKVDFIDFNSNGRYSYLIPSPTNIIFILLRKKINWFWLIHLFCCSVIWAVFIIYVESSNWNFGWPSPAVFRTTHNTPKAAGEGQPKGTSTPFKDLNITKIDFSLSMKIFLLKMWTLWVVIY